MKNSLVLILVIIAVFGGAIAADFMGQNRSDDYGYAAPSLDGFSRVDMNINGTTVHLSDRCYEVTFDVTQDQGYSIFRGIEGTIGPRPLTHDIMTDILTNFDIKLEQARIDRYYDEIYYATLYLRKGSSVLELDARPSDTIALVIRNDVPLYFDTDLLHTYGTYTCLSGG